MLRCTTDKYGRLYARWLVKPGALLEHGGLRRGERVLDLCGGTGVVAVEALKRGAGEVWLYDLNPRCPDERVIKMAGPAEAADVILGDATDQKFDLIVCRQAIGYLEPRIAFHAVKRLLSPHGRFVFNSFQEPRWRLQTYFHDGLPFLEASGFVGKHVFHLQASPTIGADVTHFRYHTKHELIVALLEAGFGINVQEKGRSLRFLCRHKPEAERIRGLRKMAKRMDFSSRRW